MKREMVFKRFERFWHWSQAALIFFLLAACRT
jgi:Ni,Fe-hydrogenase I cytochrome b subunit